MTQKRTHWASTYITLSFIIAFCAALLMSLPGLLLMIVIDGLVPQQEPLFFPHYRTEGLYLDPDSILIFWFCAGSMVLAAAVLIRRVPAFRQPHILTLKSLVLFALGSLALLIMLNFDWSEFYENDIIFSQWPTANHAILMGPLILFSLIAALPFLILAPASAREITTPVLGRGRIPISLLILAYYAAVLTASWIMATQPEWTDLFRFSSKFSAQGRGG